jgi:hypothetical protein
MTKENLMNELDEHRSGKIFGIFGMLATVIMFAMFIHAEFNGYALFAKARFVVILIMSLCGGASFSLTGYHTTRIYRIKKVLENEEMV